MAWQHVKKILILLVLCGGVALAATGYADRSINALGLAKISAQNDAYIQNAFDQALSGFLILSGIKSGLAIIEGSEIGLGFSLEVGDVVQAVYDYVDIAWKTVLAGATILMITRLILQTIVMLDQWFLVLVLTASILLLVLRWYWPRLTNSIYFLKELLLFGAVMATTLYLILPFSITGAAFMSNRITRPMIQASQDGFAVLQDELTTEHLTQKLFPEDDAEGTSILSNLDVKTKIEKTRTRLKALGLYFKERTQALAALTIKFIAGYLFDCIIFPLTFFLILYVFSKAMVRYLLGTRRSNLMRTEMERLFKTYYRAGSEPNGANSTERAPVLEPRQGAHSP
jgi:hypothetical protein